MARLYERGVQITPASEPLHEKWCKDQTHLTQPGTIIPSPIA